MKQIEVLTVSNHDICLCSTRNLTFRALAPSPSLWRRANARNVNVNVNSVDTTKNYHITNVGRMNPFIWLESVCETVKDDTRLSDVFLKWHAPYPVVLSTADLTNWQCLPTKPKNELILSPVFQTESNSVPKVTTIHSKQLSRYSTLPKYWSRF